MPSKRKKNEAASSSSPPPRPVFASPFEEELSGPIISVVETTGKVPVLEETQGNSSTPSCPMSKFLEHSLWKLEQRFTTLTKTQEALQLEITEVENQLRPLTATYLKYYKVLREVCLFEAKRKVIRLLKKAPALGETWESFMLGLSQEEVGILDLSPDAINILGTEANDLNKFAHEASVVDIAIAIICAQKQKEMWEELFQFCYEMPARTVLKAYEESDL